MNINEHAASRPVCLRGRLLFIQLLLLYFPGLQLFSIPTDNGTIPASLCYFFSLIFVPFLLRRLRGLRLPPWWLTGLILYVMGLALLRIPQYGLSKNILHWAFGAYLLVIILNVGADLTREDWLRLLEAAACLFAVVHFVFMLCHADVVRWLLNGYFNGACRGEDASHLPSLTRGGRNLDCTWLALGGFFVRGRKKGVYVTYVLLFNFLGSSRVGIIAAGLLLLWTLVYDPLYRFTKKTARGYALYAVALAAVLFCSGMAQAALGRILVDMEPPAYWFRAEARAQVLDPVQAGLERYGGTTQALLSGRAAIWENVPQMFRDGPWGYGVGNAVRIMKQRYGFTGGEDVVHNVFMQWLLDEGWIGGLWFLSLAAAFLYRQWRMRPAFFKDAFDAYFATWLVLSLVQFHGGEALMVYVLGVYLLQIKAKPVRLWPEGKGSSWQDP